MSIAAKFTEEELVILLEAARVAFSDADLFDELGDSLDIADDEMVLLREKLDTVMAGDRSVGDEDRACT